MQAQPGAARRALPGRWPLSPGRSLVRAEDGARIAAASAVKAKPTPRPKAVKHAPKPRRAAVPKPSRAKKKAGPPPVRTGLHAAQELAVPAGRLEAPTLVKSGSC